MDELTVDEGCEEGHVGQRSFQHSRLVPRFVIRLWCAYLARE